MEKKKKPTKKIPTKITENQFGSVLEDINSKLDKVTLEYLSRLDDEIQILKEELKGRPALMAIFEDRMKKMEKDLLLCKKALAI